ncbi:MAG: YbjN domain-containing protein [Acetobacteraceae bacterium]
MAGAAGSMQLAAVFSGDGKLRADKIDAVNRWNKEKRFLKAYVDDDNDVTVEMDIVAVGPVEPRELVRAISETWAMELSISRSASDEDLGRPTRRPLSRLSRDPCCSRTRRDNRSALRRFQPARFYPSEPEARAIEEMLDGEGKPRALDSMAKSLDTMMLLGEREGGRTDWLKRLTVATARVSGKQLRSSHRLPRGVCLPIFLEISLLMKALKDKRDCDGYINAAQLPLSPLERQQDARRVGVALLLAASQSWSFSERVARILWRKLWRDPGTPDEVPALIVLDDWHGVAEKASADKSKLVAFLREANARIFIGSRFFSRDKSREFLEIFAATRKTATPKDRWQILCLQPYRLRVLSRFPFVPISSG